MFIVNYYYIKQITKNKHAQHYAWNKRETTIESAYERELVEAQVQIKQSAKGWYASKLLRECRMETNFYNAFLQEYTTLQ